MTRCITLAMMKPHLLCQSNFNPLMPCPVVLSMLTSLNQSPLSVLGLNGIVFFTLFYSLHINAVQCPGQTHVIYSSIQDRCLIVLWEHTEREQKISGSSLFNLLIGQIITHNPAAAAWFSPTLRTVNTITCVKMFAALMDISALIWLNCWASVCVNCLLIWVFHKDILTWL